MDNLVQQVKVIDLKRSLVGFNPSSDPNHLPQNYGYDSGRMNRD